MSVSFWRVCKANFLLFISLYVLFPAIVAEITGRLDIYITDAAWLYLMLMTGRIVAGPFTNYLVESFKRKYLCILSLFVIALVSWGYGMVTDYHQLLLFAFIQGIAFGLISASLISLSIDLTVSECRNRANVIFAWFTRAGMILGVALGSILFLNTDFRMVIYASLLSVVAAIIYLLMIKIPFRAPIGSSVLSLDRFLLPRSWVLIINLVLIAFVAGIFIPVVFFETSNLLVFQGISIPFYCFVLAGFLPGTVIFKKKYAPKYLIAGLLIMVVSISAFILSDILIISIIAAVLLGLSLAMITPVILTLFIAMSSHCQRASANVTHSLSWGMGIIAGIIASCYFTDNYSPLVAYQAAMFSASLALVVFVVATYPYYKKKRVR